MERRGCWNIRYVVKNEYFGSHGGCDSRGLELTKGWEGISEDKGSSHNGNLMYQFVLLFNRIVFGGISQEDAECAHLRCEQWELQHKNDDWMRWVHLKDVQDSEGDEEQSLPWGPWYSPFIFLLWTKRPPWRDGELECYWTGALKAFENSELTEFKVHVHMSLSLSLPWIDRILFPTISWNDLKS